MDWKLVIAEIQKHGYSQPEIAAACGCGQATISDLVKGHTKDPRHSLGQSLQQMLARCIAEKPKRKSAKTTKPRGERIAAGTPKRPKQKRGDRDGPGRDSARQGASRGKGG